MRGYLHPPTSSIAADDTLLLDSPTLGTRRISRVDAAVALQAAAGDEVYYQKITVDGLLAALQVAIDQIETAAAAAQSAANAVKAGGLDAGSLVSAKLSTASDAAKVQLGNLAEAVIEALAGSLDADKYLGQITATGQAIATAASSSGNWYSITATGTLSGTNAPAIAVAAGDRLLSDGTAWQRYAAPPTNLSAKSITEPKLGDAAVSARVIDAVAVLSKHLTPGLKERLVNPFSTDGDLVAGFVTALGRVLLAVSADGKLAFGGQRYSAAELGKDHPDSPSEYKWGLLRNDGDGLHSLVLGIKADGSLWGLGGRVGDLLLKDDGAGGLVQDVAVDERCNVGETVGGSAFTFYSRRSGVWIPWRQGKNGYGNRARYREADLNHVVLYGQSNASRAGNAAGTNDSLTTTPHARNLMFNSYTGAGSDSGLLAPADESNSAFYRAGKITGFHPLYEGLGVDDDGETLASGIVNTLTARLGWRMLASGAAVGGYSITQLTQGSWPYLNLLYQVQSGFDLSTAAGLTHKVPAIVFIQGEADQNDTTWHTKLVALVNDLNADIKAITGQTEDIVVVIEQMNRPIWSVAEEVDLSILRANHLAGGRIYVQSPRYHIAMSNHYYPHGKRWRGCHIGEALVSILGAHEEFECVRVKDYAVSGSDLFLRFHVPAKPLVFATSENVTELISLYGFEASGLTAVSIAHDDLIRLTNSGSWSGKTLKYARQAGLGAQKGNLADSAGTVAIYNNAAAQPYPLRNWCAAFELTLP